MIYDKLLINIVIIDIEYYIKKDRVNRLIIIILIIMIGSDS